MKAYANRGPDDSIGSGLAARGENPLMNQSGTTIAKDAFLRGGSARKWPRRSRELCPTPRGGRLDGRGRKNSGGAVREENLRGEEPKLLQDLLRQRRDVRRQTLRKQAVAFRSKCGEARRTCPVLECSALRVPPRRATYTYGRAVLKARRKEFSTRGKWL